MHSARKLLAAKVDTLVAGYSKCIDAAQVALSCVELEARRLAAENEERREAIENLRGIVARIPHDQFTADGVPMFGDEAVVAPDGSRAYVRNFASTPLVTIKGESAEDDVTWELRACFSTREAWERQGAK